MNTSTTVTRCMRRSEHEWRAVMDRFDRGGLGPEAFCARAGHCAGRSAMPTCVDPGQCSMSMPNELL